MSGVGVVEGEKTITPEMIVFQEHRAKKEANALNYLIELWNFQQAGTSMKGSLISGEPASALESTSPQTPDGFFVQRPASQHEMRVFLDDQDSASGEAGGVSPTIHPTKNLTPNPSDSPPQGRSKVPGLRRLLAWFKGRVEPDMWLERTPRDRCPVCGRRG